MLKRIELHNFRKHSSTSLDFQGGLEAITGSNEVGKTTVVEAIAYAMYGAKALRDSLDDTVTYGEPANSLRVVLTLEIDGAEHVISRGKSGAELRVGDRLVTGQVEVSNAVAAAVGYDLSRAESLTLSGQNAIRGSLEEGKVATALIEKLADFDQVDRLIERIQTSLTLGSTTVVQARLDDARSNLEMCRDFVDRTPDLWTELRAAEAAEEDCASILGVRRTELETANDNLRTAKHMNDTLDRSLSDLERVTNRLQQRRDRLAEVSEKQLSARAEAAIEADLKQWTQELSTLAQRQKEYDQYLSVKPLIEISFDRLPATPQKVSDVAADTAKEVKALTQKQNDLARDRSVLEASLSSGYCGFCGQDFSNVPAVAQKNAQIQSQIDALVDGMAENSTLLTHAETRYRLWSSALSDNQKLMNKVAKVASSHLKVDDSVCPVRLTWTGTTSPADDPSDLTRKISAAKAEMAQCRELADAIVSHQSAIEDLSHEANCLREAADKLQRVDVTDLTAKVQELKDVVARASSELDQRRSDHTEAANRFREAKLRLEAVKSERDRAEAQIATCEQELRVLNFNNALLKRVREIRPKLADMVWGLVLGSISRSFSTMRGKASRVSKGSDGFLVDGRPVKSLSGSTKDILGLAVRTNLLRLFVPSADWIILDEPFHGCDETRASDMLSFLRTCGMQTIIVTHEEATVHLADNLISLT